MGSSGQRRVHGEKIQCFRETSEQMNSILYNKDEITLLNYFASNSVRILETLIRHNENQTRLIQELSCKGLSPHNLNEILEDLAKISTKITNQSLVTLESQPSLKTTSLNGTGNILGSRNTSMMSSVTGKGYLKKEIGTKELHIQRGRDENVYSGGDQKSGKTSAPSQLKNVYQQDSQSLRTTSSQRPKLKESGMAMNSGFVNEDER
eukprot:TRINITY_DN1036_c0_g1_i3.p1 TRINITY_DN1036_c0_g1~~TRINITY_DN1036_c0_g1_i3.p1  ORF type:complete len:207 (+),score=46.98 TRINITY_DN1036_c0_g1_i3:26-646(+)